jgi:hypothetical protein
VPHDFEVDWLLEEDLLRVLWLTVVSVVDVEFPFAIKELDID